MLKKWFPILFCVFFLPILVGLGCWQWGRASYKESLLHDIQQRSQHAPIDVSTLSWDADVEANRFRRVFAEGVRWQPELFFLENQMRDRRLGYFVYKVAKLSDGNSLLVNLGWLAKELEKTSIPVPDVQMIQGFLDRPPGVGIELGPVIAAEQGGRIILNRVDMYELSEKKAPGLLPLTLKLAPTQDDGTNSGLVREWQPATLPMGPEKHIGYAIQWWALAVTLVVLTIILLVRQRNND